MGTFCTDAGQFLNLQKIFCTVSSFPSKKGRKWVRFTDPKVSQNVIYIKKSSYLGIGGRCRTNQIARTVNRQFHSNPANSFPDILYELHA